MTVHVGLIGAGNITGTHARAVSETPDASVAAVFGSNPEKVRALSAEYGCAHYTDFERFLAHKPMDMVTIGSPSGLHAEQGIAAARCGLHVLTEKPLDVSTTRADELISETAKAHVKLGVFFQDRFKPGIRRLKDCVDSGALGKPILADARVKWYRPPDYYKNSRWRGTRAFDGGGALINQAIHTLDLLLWIFGDVVAVQARKTTALHDIEAEDTLVATLEFANGALGSVIATTSVFPGYPRRIELSGSEGTLILTDDQLTAANLRDSATTPRLEPAGDPVDDRAASPLISDFLPHQAVLEDFIRAIQSGGEPLCNGREGRRSLALVEAIYASCLAVGASSSFERDEPPVSIRRVRRLPSQR